MLVPRPVLGGLLTRCLCRLAEEIAAAILHPNVVVETHDPPNVAVAEIVTQDKGYL